MPRDFFDNFPHHKLLAARAIILLLVKRLGGTVEIKSEDLEAMRDHHMLHRGEADRFFIALGKKCKDPNCAHRGISKEPDQP